MAKEVTLVLNIDVNKSMNSLMGIRQEMRNVQKAMEQAASTGNQVAYEQLSKRFAQLRDRAEELNNALQPMDRQIRTITRGIGGLVSVGQNLSLVFGANSKSAEELFKTFAKVQAITNIVNGFNEIIDILPKVTTSLKMVGSTMQAAFAANPIGLIVTGVVALGTAVAYLSTRQKEYNREIEKTKEIEQSILNIKNETAKGMASELSRLSILISKYEDTNTTSRERKRIIAEINENYKELIGYQIKENATLQDLKNSYNDIVSVLYKKYQTQAVEKELVALFEKRTKLQMELNKVETIGIENVDKYNSLIEEREKLLAENNSKNLERLIAIQKEIDETKKFTDINKGAANMAKVFSDEIKVLDDQIRTITQTFKDYLVVGKKEEPEFKRTIEKIEKMNTIRATQVELTEKINDDIKKSDEKSLSYYLEILAKRIEAEKEYTKTEEEELNERWEKGLIGWTEYNEKIVEIEKEKTKKIIDERFKIIEAEIKFAMSVGDIFTNLSKLIGDKTREGAAIQKGATLFSIAANTAYALMENMKDAAVVGITPIEKAIIFASSVAQVLSAAAQAKQILSSETPNFARGGLVGGVYDGTDNQLIKAMPGEAIINRAATQRYAPLLSAINQTTGGREIGGYTSTLIDYDLLASKINEKRVILVTSDVNEAQDRLAKRIQRAKLK